MKKTNIFKLVGIIAFIAIIGFVMASCEGQAGGIIYIANNATIPVYVQVLKVGSNPVTNGDKEIAASVSETFSFSEKCDVKIHYRWNTSDSYSQSSESIRLEHHGISHVFYSFNEDGTLEIHPTE